MKNCRKYLISVASFAIIGSLLLMTGCGKKSGSTTESQTTTYTVQKGNLVSTVSAVGTVQMPQQIKLTFGTGNSTSSLYTIKEIDVAYGDEVKKGDVLAKIDTSSLETTIEKDKIALNTAQTALEEAKSEVTLLNAQASVKNAQATLDLAQNALDQLTASQVTDAQTAISDAQLALDKAELALETTRKTVENGIISAENAVTSARNTVSEKTNVARDAKQTYDTYVINNIVNLERWDIAYQKDKYALASRVAEDALSSAEDAVKSAQDNLDKVKAEGNFSIIEAQNAVTSAENNLKNAKDDLTVIECENPDMLKQEAAVATAQASLLTAQKTLADVQSGGNIESLQLNVDNAQSQLDSDNAQLEAATITAPYDGVIAAVNADVGDKVTATEEIIYLVNTGKVEISSSVDETDVASVAKGQKAIVTFDAIEGASLEGTLAAISPVAASSSNVTTYSFTIEIQDIKGYALKQGMSASAEIVVVNKPDVLLVPAKAIKSMGPNKTVQVQKDDGTIEPRTIQTGDTNGTLTEVTSGLTLGEKIMVTTSSSSGTSSKTQSGPQFFFEGGGPPGGGSIRIGPGS